VSLDFAALQLVREGASAGGVVAVAFRPAVPDLPPGVTPFLHDHLVWWDTSEPLRLSRLPPGPTWVRVYLPGREADFEVDLNAGNVRRLLVR